MSARILDHKTIQQRVHDALEAVLSDYRTELEQQRRLMEQTLASASVSRLWPRTRPHLTPSALRVIIRCPVYREHAAEIDNRLTRLLKALQREPAIKRLASVVPP